jgi:DNA-binding Xre family transcriptional regulator
MELVEFVIGFGDADPWSVPGAEWRARLDAAGRLPEGWFLLDDPDARSIVREVDSPLADALREIDRRVSGMNGEQPNAEHAPETPGFGHLTTSVARVLWLRRLSGRKHIRALSRASGIATSTICRIEKLQRGITLDQLERLADALGCSVWAILEEARAGTGTR